MPGTTPLIGAPYGQPGDSITDILEVDDLALHVEKYTNLRYTSTAARDAAIPVPEWGMVATVGTSAANRIVYFYNGSAWQVIYQPITWTTSTPAQYTGTIGYGRQDNTGYVSFALTSAGAAGTNVSPAFLTLPSNLRPVSRDAYGPIYVRTSGGVTSSYLGLVSTGGSVQILNMTVANTNTVIGQIQFALG